MWRTVLFLLLIALIRTWYVLRPQGRSWSDCNTPKGIICIPKGPLVAQTAPEIERYRLGITPARLQKGCKLADPSQRPDLLLGKLKRALLRFV